MKDTSIEKALRKAMIAPEKSAMNRCIENLPPIRPRCKLGPLILLQCRSLPGRLYALGIGVALVQWLTFLNADPISAIISASISSAAVIFLFAWHWTLWAVGEMDEVEKCCKYSYGQLLLARMAVLSALSLMFYLLIMLPGSHIRQLGGRYMAAATLPTLVGALCGLIGVNHGRFGNTAMLTTYLVAALVTGLSIQSIAEWPGLMLGLMLSAVTLGLVFQIKALMNRRRYHEACDF